MNKGKMMNISSLGSLHRNIAIIQNDGTFQDRSIHAER